MAGDDNIIETKKTLSKKQIISIIFINSIFWYPIGLALGFNPLNGLSLFNNLFVGTIVFLFVGGIIRNFVGGNSGQIIGFFYGIIFGCLFGGFFGYIFSMISSHLLSEFVILLTDFKFYDLNSIYNQSLIGIFDFSGIYSQSAFKSYILVGGTFFGGIVGLIRGSYVGLMAGKDNEKLDERGNYEKSIEINTQNENAWVNKGDIASYLSISRETEFYQGYIRLKMSVTNTSSFVVNDVTLDFDFDDDLLRMDRHDPDYQIKNGKIILGNISGNSSKTVAVYFDPMMCSKGTDINCQINFKNAKGQLQTNRMEPKKISVVCPIMETESDINIGRLKEFIEKLPYRDSKVYQLQNDFDIDVLKNISREVVQKHDVKNIRTLFTKDEKVCELWYYGKTKVNNHDIVIKITILSETQNIELFAATQTAESLAGLLAEVGRELKSAIEHGITGNVQQVINVSIMDSIIQRSNLLSYCDIDGKCTGDVVIENSLVQRSNIGFDTEVKDSMVTHTDFRTDEMEKEQERLKKQKEEEERAKKEKEEQDKLAREVNSIGMKFTLIPAGEFMMGSNEDEDEQPVHKVKIGKPFYLGTYSVTQREWKAVMGSNPPYFKGDDLPVENVSWDDAQEFVKKLNAKEGTDKYRLPSEAEWEYACRAGTTTRYSFGDSESKLGEYAWYDDNSGSKIHPGGQKKPNQWSLYDMNGNVMGWVQDTYHDSYKGAHSDGSAWEDGDSPYRVSRGGCWYSNAMGSLSAHRYYNSPGYCHYNGQGFRLLQEM